MIGEYMYPAEKEVPDNDTKPNDNLGEANKMIQTLEDMTATLAKPKDQHQPLNAQSISTPISISIKPQN
ncbi:hypothetical protein Bhyg_07877, partial [Pseudolycoriella hygida]